MTALGRRFFKKLSRTEPCEEQKILDRLAVAAKLFRGELERIPDLRCREAALLHVRKAEEQALLALVPMKYVGPTDALSGPRER